MPNWYPTADLHCDALGRLTAEGEDFFLSKPLTANFPQMRQGGVVIQFFAAWVSPRHRPYGPLHQVLSMIAAFWSKIAVSPEVHPIIFREQLESQALLEGEGLGAVLAVEGGEALEGELGMLSNLFRLGVRSMTLTWNHRNDLADGVSEEPAGGLTRFGRRVVQEMQKMGMLVDVAHLAKPGFWDVIKLTQAPIIASHANANSLCPHPRNLTDDQVRAIAQTGGLIGVTMVPHFLHTDPASADLEVLFRHIDYLCNLVGSEYVAVGSDFEGSDVFPVGLADPTCWPSIWSFLETKGYPQQVIRGLAWENAMRVLRTVLPAGEVAGPAGYL